MSASAQGFTDEQEQFRQTAVARFARDRVAPGLPGPGLASRATPWTLHAELGALGVLGIGLAGEASAGRGRKTRSLLGIACEELGAADVNLAAAPGHGGAHRRAAGQGRDARGPGTLAAPDDRRQPQVVAFGLTEPEAGSDAASLRTTATFRWTAGGGSAAQKNSVSHLSWPPRRRSSTPGCRAAPGPAGVSAFLVEARPAPACRPAARSPTWDSCPSAAARCYLDEVFVPGREPRGDRAGSRFFAMTLMSHFDYSRAAIGLQCLGAARAEPGGDLRLRSRQRQAFGQPIAAFQGVSLPLAEQATLVDAARLGSATARCGCGRPACRTPPRRRCASGGHPVVAKNAIEVCLLTHGHYGWSDEMPFQQRFRDVFGYQIGDGTAQIQKQVIATRLIGREVRDR